MLKKKEEPLFWCGCYKPTFGTHERSGEVSLWNEANSNWYTSHVAAQCKQ